VLPEPPRPPDVPALLIAPPPPEPPDAPCLPVLLFVSLLNPPPPPPADVIVVRPEPEIEESEPLLP
jgi:hypothetical protein